MNIFLENSLILKSLDESTKTFLGVDKSNTEFIKDVFEENKKKIKKFESSTDVSLKNVSNINLEKFKQSQKIQISAKLKLDYETINGYYCQITLSRLNDKIVAIEILGEKNGKIKTCIVYRSLSIL
jgi:hypothetical protein